MPGVVVAVRADRLSHMDITFAVGCAAPQWFSMRAAAVAASAVVVVAHPVALVACTRGGVDRPVAGCGEGDEHLRTIGHCYGDVVVAASGASVHARRTIWSTTALVSMVAGTPGNTSVGAVVAAVPVDPGRCRCARRWTGWCGSRHAVAGIVRPKW